VLFFFLTFSFPVPRFGSGNTDAGTIPRVWFYALAPAVILTLIPIVRGQTDPDPKWGNLRLMGLVFVALVVSVGLMGTIGYYVSSAIFIVVTMWLLGSRGKIELAVVPLGWVLFSYFLFAQLLNVRLPIGSVFAAIF